MRTVYETQGTCSKAIELDVDDATGIINSVQFIGGCAGNTVGVSQLVRGMKAEDVISRLEGIRCGMKPTSCPDQLAHALRQVMNK
ncbi:MAG: TIGR03905 family TSCPD domain-containing protein [Bacteroidaceae bacterium]|nr:TIGR03905 family TSCPD domain-containing protein [Bacteroidaceae bacterium]